MKMTKTQNGTSMDIVLEGRLDTESAPELAAELKDGLGQIEKLTVDMSEVEYVSSSGLRVLIKARNSLKYGGEMIIANANELVREVFDLTGISNIFTMK